MCMKTRRRNKTGKRSKRRSISGSKSVTIIWLKTSWVSVVVMDILKIRAFKLVDSNLVVVVVVLVVVVVVLVE